MPLFDICKSSEGNVGTMGLASLFSKALERIAIRSLERTSYMYVGGHGRMLRNLGLRENPVIFDIGGNLGQSVREYRSLFPKAFIHSFEPDPACYAELQKVCGRDGQAIANHLGVADSVGSLELNRNSSSATNSFVPLDMTSSWRASIQSVTIDKIEVPVTTIDAYCINNNIDCIDLLKIDTQGYEVECLSGGLTMLSQRRIKFIRVEVILASFYQRRVSFGDIENVLGKYGYVLWGIFDLHYSSDGQLCQADALYCCP